MYSVHTVSALVYNCDQRLKHCIIYSFAINIIFQVIYHMLLQGIISTPSCYTCAIRFSHLYRPKWTCRSQGVCSLLRLEPFKSVLPAPAQNNLQLIHPASPNNDFDSFHSLEYLTLFVWTVPIRIVAIWGVGLTKSFPYLAERQLHYIQDNENVWSPPRHHPWWWWRPGQFVSQGSTLGVSQSLVSVVLASSAPFGFLRPLWAYALAFGAQ